MTLQLDTSFQIYEDLSKTDNRFQYILPAFNFNKNIKIPENYNGEFNLIQVVIINIIIPMCLKQF